MSAGGRGLDGWKAGATSPVEESEGSGPDSPMDRFPLEYRSRALPPPPKPTSPLPPLPSSAIEDDSPPPFASHSPRATHSSLGAPPLPDERRFSNRTLSPTALAALADTPPRPTSMARPTVPLKSSARLSQTSRDSGMFEAEGFSNSRSRSASSSSTSGNRLASVVAPPTPLTTASPILAFAQPRPRNPSTRTPVLSMAGSSSSRASSSVFTPSGTSSGHSRDGTDRGRISSVGSEELVVEEDKGATIGRSQKLRLERPTFELGGLGIAGFGGELGDDDDLQRGLDELALYARSLPSPLPRIESQEPEDDRTMICHPPTALPLDARRPSLAASSRTSTVDSLSSQGSRRPSVRTRHSSDTPPSSTTNLSRPLARRRSIREPFEASESDLELSVDESGIDDSTTDDEDAASGGYSRHYLAFGEKEGGSPGSFFYPGSATVGVRDGWGGGEDEEVLSPDVDNKGVLDRSGTSIEGLQIGPSESFRVRRVESGES